MNEKNVELFKQNINRIKENSNADIDKLILKYDVSLYISNRIWIENYFKVIEDWFKFKCADYIN